MTEYALPFPGTTIGDAGPYPVGGATIPGWWDKATLLDRAGGRLTQTTLADIGVYYSVDDQLECTVAADTTSIDVDTGASLVDGTMHYNDTDPVNVPIPAAAAGLGRIDVVVVRKNYQTGTTYTPGGAAPTVGPRECRITVIRGSEAGSPVAPSVTQDTTRATYWDVPLCSVQVNDAGTLSSLTDLREYVDAIIYRRQGGSATVWATAGTTDYRPGGGRIQAGAISWTGGAATSGSQTVTFPEAFTNTPIILATGSQVGASIVAVDVGSTTNATAQLRWESVDGVTTYTFVQMFWYAIGE